MCEQTEINYLDGDVVWVKLGGCWWPGQVTGFHNLPDDIQEEFQKKPLIAAVKFFQEDTYEFVKNYQQIYKYNCTLKDDFIKKGLDKYRTKTKDGSRYMDKFPGDVEMAEKLTGGDPDILSSDKFSPEVKPNISDLFGEKKLPKKKRDREDSHRRSDSFDLSRKITHPRFLKESDHEVRIRQQPSSLPSTPNSTGSPQYPCHMCNFTSSRINVIICHIKSHRSGSSPMARSKVKSYSQSRGRISDTDTPKRKYVRKERSQTSKSKGSSESVKRKQTKQTDKAPKKKKTDPKIRDTILADWEDESDEDIGLNQSTPLDVSSIIGLPTKSQSDIDQPEESNQKSNALTDGNEIIAETEKLLRETENLTAINIVEDPLISKDLQLSKAEKKSEEVDDVKTSDALNDESSGKSQKEKEASSSDNENKRTTPGKDDKKSLLSCFDFHEEEPSIPPVRKKSRAFHQKKEIIKEFEMSQALKIGQEKAMDGDRAAKVKSSDKNLKNHENSEGLQVQAKVQDSKEVEKGSETRDKTETIKSTVAKTEEKMKAETVPREDSQKGGVNASETELEIVEIFEVEKEEVENEDTANSSKVMAEESLVSKKTEAKTEANKESDELRLPSKSIFEKKKISEDLIAETRIAEGADSTPSKEFDETLSERFTTETEDETVSESAETFPEQSEPSDVDMLDPDQVPNAMNVLLSNQQLNVTPKIKRRRGRPRKNVDTSRTSTSGSESPRVQENKNHKQMLEKLKVERKTSESDSDRSYSGRKRKPNKKYLESTIYVQDADQKVFKTDESQSESDDKNSEKIRGKYRRSRRSMGLGKKKTEDTGLQGEQELEVSCGVSDAAENNINLPKVDLKDDLLEIDKQKDLTEFDAKPAEKSKEDEEVTTKGPETLGLLDAVKSPEAANSSTTDETKSELEKVDNTDVEMESPLNDKELKKEDLKNISTVSTNTIRLDSFPAKEQSSQQSEVSKTAIDMLPPKKSQIKKFELSQIDFFDTDASPNKVIKEPEQDKSKEMENEDVKTDTKEKEIDTSPQKEKLFTENSQATPKKIEKPSKIKEEKKTPKVEESLLAKQEGINQAEPKTPEKQESVLKSESFEQISKDPTNASQEQALKRPSMQTRYKGTFTPETGAIKSKKDKDLFSDEKATNTFQEAFLKTLHMDKKKGFTEDAEAALAKGRKGKKTFKKRLEEQDNSNLSTAVLQETKIEISTEKLDVSKNVLQIPENNSQASEANDFSGMEAMINQSVEIDTKAIDAINIDQPTSSTTDMTDVTSKLSTQTLSLEDKAKPVGVDAPKIEESSKTSTSIPSPTSDVAVPVKKREMPRIIENVALTEPMQILKSKLLDKLPQKGVKHKLETESAKKTDQKGSPRAKLMKLESMPSNSKTKNVSKVLSPHMSLTKKLQVLKTEENEAAALLESQKEKMSVKSPKVSTSSATEKYIQQSSQSLADMELDINSMPFVLSEDVLTPESIEQMPVVISSMIPTPNSNPGALSFTPAAQIISPTHTQFKLTNEGTSGELSPTKKKSGTPAILKSKSKAKPTITSIKTLVPPLTGGVKGLKFQSASPSKAAQPVLTQKGSPGKYVVVQTAGGQQLRYSVQGKSGTQQKIAIPTGKSAGNAQVVHQGNKVVILTSAQSGQTKMLPMNISKQLTGKVQRIMTSKGQVFCPINPQGIITSKTIIAPKGDGVSPTTSKIAPAHKIINTQGIITSKGVLTPIPGTIAKTALLGTLSQGILTKGGIYTPISASTLAGKTIIGSKTLVTKGATILSSPNLGASKAILTPITQTIGGKTILSGQGIVTSKATVLTPITGQQVKAIAAKSPTKSGSKMQYQAVQQKVQLPMLTKSQKVSMSSSSPGRSGQLKTGGGPVVLQNTSPALKAAQQGKKGMKQTMVQQGGTLQNITSQGGAQQTVGMISHVQQKGKVTSTSKVVIPRGGRHAKSQQKIVVQKVQEQAITTVQNIQAKQASIPPGGSPSTSSKLLSQHKQVGSAISAGVKTAKGHATSSKNVHHQQKNLLNIAMNTAAATNVNTNLSSSLSLPPLEPIDPEKKSKIDNLLVEAASKEVQPKIDKIGEKSGDVEKTEEPKLTAQPQIMALPTESSDGTQTYVLVTIDEQGQIQPLDNNTLMSLEGTTQNPDGTRTLYIDPSSLGEAGTLDNIVLQIDNGVMPQIQTSGAESTQAIITESFPASEVIQTSNQDILAAALANTDFQQEINLPENPTASVMTTGLTQTSLINQTILQSTIIPPTEPISSPAVLETSLTLNQPIMTPLEVPSNLPIQSKSTPSSSQRLLPTTLELPITITNPTISYIAASEAQIQIPGNSMPDIGEIMENPGTTVHPTTEIPASTQYLVLPNLEDNITVEAQSVQNGASVSYSVSIPNNNIVLQSPQVQTTPSMPIIDDTYAESVQFTATMEPSISTEQQTFVDVPVSEMLVSKAPIATENVPAPDVTVTSEMVISHQVPGSSQESIVSIVSSNEQEAYSSQEVDTENKVPRETDDSNVVDKNEAASGNDTSARMEIEEPTSEPMTTSMPIIDETTLVTSESNVKPSSEEPMNFEVSDSQNCVGTLDTSQESKSLEKFKQLTFSEQSTSKARSPTTEEDQSAISNEVEPLEKASEVLPDESPNHLDDQAMDTDEPATSKIYPASSIKPTDDCQRDEPSSQGESGLTRRNLELHFEETNAETSHETPSQSYEQFGMSMNTATTDSADLPSQSASKSENSREPSQSIAYEPIETDEETITTEPPSQSFEHSKMNEASQSYDASGEASTNAPTQSFNELLQSQEERGAIDEAIDETIDDRTFPTQSYEVGKGESLSENLETDAEISQEGNIPSQSNDIGTDGIGTSSVSTNNSGLNEDETASSSYVPETPENQERDQDQESAISTSSYEIPPCEELNIASSSVIPDTSAGAEHTSIHDNGVPEIPTSSYNINPDITSTHVDSVPTSSYEDQVIVEQNVSTSYEVPISMPGLEETCSQNFVTESTDHRNEPSSYYAHHQEVTASYYESVDQETNSRLEEDPQEEVTPSYYEGNPQEASQSYFAPEEATPSYSSHNVSPGYYDPRPETEASQSYYSTDDIEKNEQSSSRNIEASQSFYQEQSDELKLRQQGEATPTYTERYPVDYTLDNSPIERHDLVESSVPATRPTER